MKDAEKRIKAQIAAWKITQSYLRVEVTKK